MNDYLGKPIGLGIQGVALKSGALKKQKHDEEIMLDIMNRGTPIGVQPVQKHRPEMAGGFRIGDRSGGQQDMELDERGFDFDENGNMLNPLSKDELFARMGIDGSKEYELDWNKAKLDGTARNRIELADKMFDVLQKEKEKLAYRKNLLESRIHSVKAGNTPADFHGLHAHPNQGRGGSPGASQMQHSSNHAYNPQQSALRHSVGANQRPYITGITDQRLEMANYEGFRPPKLPYEDEADIMHEEEGRFQEINHWYSSMEKPNEDNVEVLKKLNHERLDHLGQLLHSKRMELASLERMNKTGENFDTKARKHGTVQKTRREINKERQNYKDKFKMYLHNKDRQRGQTSSEERRDLRDFDRYECTSPDPKRVKHDYNVPYLENV